MEAHFEAFTALLPLRDSGARLGNSLGSSGIDAANLEDSRYLETSSKFITAQVSQQAVLVGSQNS